MAKKIQIIYDIDKKPIDVAIDATLNLKQQFRELTKEINKTQEGTREFELLSSKLGDVKDKMETTTAKSRDLFGSLSLLPGPVGAFANTVDSAIGSLKLFSSFSFKDLKFQLGETLNDFKDIASNIGKATGITKIYTTLNNALAKSFVAVGVGEQAAATGARAFAAALTATGIGLLVVALGAAATALYDMATGEDEAAAAAAKLNRELESQNQLLDLNQKAAKRRNAETIATMKALGKSEKEIRDTQIKQAYNDYNDAYAAEQEARKLYNANLGKADAEGLKKLEENLDKRIEATKDAYSTYIVTGRNAQAAELADQKQAQEKAAQSAKAHQEKIAADRKAANEMLIDLQQENAVLALKTERERQDQELKNQKADEQAKINALLISQEKKNQLLEQVTKKYDAKANDLKIKRKEDDAKLADEQLKEQEEFAKKLAEISLSAIEDGVEKEKALRQEKYSEDLRALEADKNFIKMSEEAKAYYRQELRTALNNDLNKIELDAKIKAGQDELMILEAQQKTLLSGTDAYYQNALAIENKAYELKIAAAKGNAKQIEAINIEHAQNLKNIDLAAFEAKKQIEIQKYQVVAGIGASLQQLAGKNKALAIGGIVIEKAAAIGQIVANTQIANAKSVAASPLTFGQPWVTINTIAGVLSGAATIAAAAKAISEINGSGSSSATAEAAPSGASAASLGKNYGSGGMINGPRHAQGGVMINAEGGEAVMTRGAVTMFAPLLSAMNQMGGGTSFAQGGLVGAAMDNPTTNNPSAEQQPMILKTYIVEQELTSAQERMARLKDLSTL